jgi:hypothetical protein
MTKWGIYHHDQIGIRYWNQLVPPNPMVNLLSMSGHIGRLLHS